MQVHLTLGFIGKIAATFAAFCDRMSLPEDSPIRMDIFNTIPSAILRIAIFQLCRYASADCTVEEQHVLDMIQVKPSRKLLIVPS